MVLEIGPPTARVKIVNVAVADPVGTVTLAGTVIGSAPDNDTTAPPAGAAAVRVTAPLTVCPPTTLDAPTEIDASATRCAVTVSIGD